MSTAFFRPKKFAKSNNTARFQNTRRSASITFHISRKEPCIATAVRVKLAMRKEKGVFQWESGLLSRKLEKEKDVMKSNNQINIPQARDAMDKFKMQAAQEVGVDLKNGYNGHLTSREAGSVGGQMVKKMIEAYEQGLQ